MQKIILRSLPALLCTIFLAPTLAYAHTGVGHAAGFANGFGHPIGGLDHVLAMIAVGIWASQFGGKSILAVPSTFVGVMILGCIMGTAGITVPFIEEGIIISVLMLGVLIAAATRMPLAASMAIVGLFAVFHGHAHGTEMPIAISGLTNGAGFAIATALLHLCGIGLMFFFQKTVGVKFIRYAGATIAAVGIFMFTA